MELKQGLAGGNRKKISRVSVVDQVSEELKRRIADNEWDPGDKLPSEAELAEYFGVNRLSVRMALQKLSTLGLVETKTGEGTYVRKFSFNPFLDEIFVFYDNDERFRDVQQLRVLIEGASIQAAQYASDKEKEELKLLLDEYNQELYEYSRDPDNDLRLERLVDADLAFHIKIVRLSHNKLFEDIYLMVQKLVRGHIAGLLSSRMKKRSAAGIIPDAKDDTHTKIFESIIKGDEALMKAAQEELFDIVTVTDQDQAQR